LGYAYIYNLTGVAVAVEAAVPFDSNGLMTSGFGHVLGSTDITITIAGTYSVHFSASVVESSQFAIFITPNGGASTLVAGSIYGSGAGTQQNTGDVIFALSASDVAGSGAVLNLVNHTSAAAVTLQSPPATAPAGGTAANSNASLRIQQLA